MIDFIQSETKKIMYNCIKKYAEKEKKDISDVQLVLGLDENGNTYTLCEQYQPKIELSLIHI